MGKKYTYEEVKNIFKENGFKLLTTEYKDCKESLLCQDKLGYKI